MIDLKRYFVVPFEDPRISRDEFLLFSGDHLERLKTQNLAGPYAGLLTAMIAATQPLYDAFNDGMSNRDSAIATREGGTMTKDQALLAFQQRVSRREGTIKGEFGKPSPQYEEFFPHGLTEYWKATMANAEVLMDRMVTKTTKYQAELGAPMVTEFTDLRTSFTTSRSSQLGQKSDVAGARSALDDARSLLEEQTTKNILVLAGMCLREPEKLSLFCDQTLLHDPDRSEDEPETPPVPPPGP